MRHLFLAAAVAGTFAIASTAQAQTNIAPPQFGGDIAPRPALASSNYFGTNATIRTGLSASQVKRRMSLRDRDGRYIGWVESVSKEGAVIRFHGGSTLVPYKSLGADPWGLRVRMTRRDFIAAAADQPAAE